MNVQSLRAVFLGAVLSVGIPGYKLLNASGAAVPVGVEPVQPTSSQQQKEEVGIIALAASAAIPSPTDVASVAVPIATTVPRAQYNKSGTFSSASSDVVNPWGVGAPQPPSPKKQGGARSTRDIF
jgi:hypothetical protein